MKWPGKQWGQTFLTNYYYPLHLQILEYQLSSTATEHHLLWLKLWIAPPVRVIGVHVNYILCELFPITRGKDIQVSQNQFGSCLRIKSNHLQIFCLPVCVCVCICKCAWCVHICTRVCKCRCTYVCMAVEAQGWCGSLLSIVLHLMHWGRASQLNPEPSGITSLANHSALGFLCLCHTH